MISFQYSFFKLLYMLFNINLIKYKNLLVFFIYVIQSNINTNYIVMIKKLLRKLSINLLDYFIKAHPIIVQKILNYISFKVYNEIGYLEQVKNNTNVEAVIDVGVHEGTPNLYKVFEDKYFFLVDPVADLIKHKPKNYKFIQKGLGEKNKTKSFNIHKNSGLSSYKEELQLNRGIASKPIKIIETEIITLDSLIDTEMIKHQKIGIKLDAQGTEYEILEGLVKNIDKVDFIILENNILPRYKDSKLFSELTSLLLKKGFYFLNILNPSSTIPRYAYDCLFLNKNNNLFKTTLIE